MLLTDTFVFMCYNTSGWKTLNSTSVCIGPPHRSSQQIFHASACRPLFSSEFLVCISCFFLPYKYTTPWVIVCFRLKKKKWMGRRQHLRLSPAVSPSSVPPLLDLLHMKQHHVTECCLKLLPKSRAVQHQPGSDFTRCVTCSCLYHAFEN